jgi:hypothetical protein
MGKHSHSHTCEKRVHITEFVSYVTKQGRVAATETISNLEATHPLIFKRFKRGQIRGAFVDCRPWVLDIPDYALTLHQCVTLLGVLPVATDADFGEDIGKYLVRKFGEDTDLDSPELAYCWNASAPEGTGFCRLCMKFLPLDEIAWGAVLCKKHENFEYDNEVQEIHDDITDAVTKGVMRDFDAMYEDFFTHEEIETLMTPLGFTISESGWKPETARAVMTNSYQRLMQGESNDVCQEKSTWTNEVGRTVYLLLVEIGNTGSMRVSPNPIDIVWHRRGDTYTPRSSDWVQSRGSAVPRRL